LLLHGFMNGGAVTFFDAIELIDAAQASVGQN
jgi:hypothetical protein